MNKWVKKSFELVKEKHYLDRLLEVYTAEETSRDLKTEEASSSLKSLYKNKDGKGFIKELIRLKKIGFKFPIENPYISFLSHYSAAVDKNPKTVKKLSGILFKMDYDDIVGRLEEPKKASRRIGPMFKFWINKNFRVLDKEAFDDSKVTSFLAGSDTALKDFAESGLQCKFIKFSKGLDFVAKTRTKYVVGTTKLITDFGGSQDNGFLEAIRLVRYAKCPKNVKRLAIIDGVAWLGGNMKAALECLEEGEVCISVLLLEDYLKTI